MIHQIINNTIPDDISFGYLGGDDDETIIKPPICLTTQTGSKPTASVRSIQPTLVPTISTIFPTNRRRKYKSTSTSATH